MHDMDEYVQAQLILAALNITTHVLKPGTEKAATMKRKEEGTLLKCSLLLFRGNIHRQNISGQRRDVAL